MKTKETNEDLISHTEQLKELLARMTEKKEKLYPSDISSKSIACRVPMSYYLDFLTESQKLGISLNDLFLMKLFKKEESISGVINRNVLPEYFLNFINDFDDIRLTDSYNEETNQYEYPREIDPPLFKTKEVMSIEINNGGGAHYCYSLQELISYCENIFEEYRNSKKKATIEDVKTQLTILISNKFDDLKDRRLYHKELLLLLKELE